jgi:hypothetical protein
MATRQQAHTSCSESHNSELDSGGMVALIVDLLLAKGVDKVAEDGGHHLLPQRLVSPAGGLQQQALACLDEERGGELCRVVEGQGVVDTHCTELHLIQQQEGGLTLAVAQDMVVVQPYGFCIYFLIMQCNLIIAHQQFQGCMWKCCWTVENLLCMYVCM